VLQRYMHTQHTVNVHGCLSFGSHLR